jgi:hypothetical protein
VIEGGFPFLGLLYLGSGQFGCVSDGFQTEFGLAVRPLSLVTVAKG